jgi:hypothetical protein
MTNFKKSSTINAAFLSLVLLSFIISACAPNQEISRTWADKTAIRQEPYKSVFVLALIKPENKPIIEKKMAKVVSSRGFSVVKASDVMPELPINAEGKIDREKLVKTINDNKCDAMLVLALKNIKTEKVYGKTSGQTDVPTHQIWDPIVDYTPLEFGYYGIYYKYVSDYQEQKYSVNEYALDRTFFLETNLYDIATEKLIWSIQSTANNPEDLDSFFKGYSKLLSDHLKKEGLKMNK